MYRRRESPETLQRLQARVNAYLEVLVLGRNDTIELPPLDYGVLDLPTRDVLPGEDLCVVCKRLDLSTIRGESDDEVEFLLGHVEDIVQTERCALCRLVKQSLLLNWTKLPLYAKDGSRIRCHLFIPGPHHGRGRREIVVLPLVPDSGDRDGALALDSRPTLKLLHDDLTLVKPDMSGKISDVARKIPLQCDLNFFAESYRTCRQKHGLRCEWFKFLPLPSSAKESGESLKAMSFAQDLRVIDIEKQSVIRAPFQCQFVALSYVWGKIEFLRLTKDNRAELEQDGALRKYKPPATVRDAMDLVRALGERYIWVDALCIVQDDNDDKKVQIQQMDIIYSAAVLTIVAAGGMDAHAPLPGLLPATRSPHQPIESINGLRFAATGPGLAETMSRLCWNTRGWTFQELALSKRALCFMPDQVYYMCRTGICSEDSIPEALQSSQTFPGRSLDVFGLNADRGVWHCYTSMVNQFTSREFTYESDVIDALDGLFSSLRTVEDEAFICGLPETFLDAALLWQLSAPLRRRKPLPSGEDIPSWSWAGWVGKTGYSWYINPDDIHAEITGWAITTSTDTYSLYVDPNYNSRSDYESVERSRWRGLRDGRLPSAGFEATSPPWKPSPWRSESPVEVRAKRAVQQKHASWQGDHSLSYKYSSDAHGLPRILSGTLCFKTRMASFIIGCDRGKWFVNEMRPGQRTLEPLLLLYREGRKPAIWVGTLLVETEEAKTMDQLSIGQFIILSSTSTCLSPIKYEYGVRLPANGTIYDETRFGPLRETSEEPPTLYNVMWINWRPSGSTRRGIGQVHRDGWELADSLERTIKLK
ncbi:HET-domain-containing protein [Trematosphaeria pertusa]|uniref:HET-domain-containing protein n=1 Tax=Trematosphaeria pertusa TaxID=390896 RepID=A0A6A6I9P7_9PLEO|nr:HET-domain-containing protein [Trematosphaeria pertusa]KAF2247304.1 HET-domain-containing protein [Trematosphaeria pertusa]